MAEQRRNRWPGFVIGNDEVGQTIRAWLDQVQDDPAVNVSEIVRTLLYEYITGEVPDPVMRRVLSSLETIAAHIEDHTSHIDGLSREIRRIAATGVRAPAGGPEPTEDRKASIKRRLGSSLPD